ncbi:hypothetical protein SAMN05444387_1395 [Flavobacterium pectinovorum]|uniref:Uncharacterized protein n=1 Tax=Flavobacterium pectinovorum TaxID=29533 RepID=A0ABY1J0V4_9FLAO|nr:hypothetical protein SAMN05444387_1395 [Flavobacterium pectinovorum]
MEISFKKKKLVITTSIEITVNSDFSAEILKFSIYLFNLLRINFFNLIYNNLCQPFMTFECPPCNMRSQ